MAKPKAVASLPPGLPRVALRDSLPRNVTTPFRLLFEKVRRNLTLVGLPGTLLHAIDRLLSVVSGGRARLYAYAFLAQPIGSQAFPPMRDSAATTVSFVGPHDLIVASFAPRSNVIAQRFASGARCLAATMRGNFAGTIWIAESSYAEDEVRCLYVLADAKRCVWDFDVYVAPRYRGGRVLARLWQEANAQLSSSGVQWSLSRISLLNAESLAAHGQLGASKIGFACFFVIGGSQLSLISRRPYLHFSANHTQRPLIVFDLPLKE